MERFALSPDLDQPALSSHFAAHGWVRIPGFLQAPGAAALVRSLLGRDDWRRTFIHNFERVDVDRRQYEALPEHDRREIERGIALHAREDFAYRYENIRVPTAAQRRAASDDPLCAFARWMSDGPPREFLRAVTGDQRIVFADAHATAFSAGDFLTGHNDDVGGKNRMAAYVLGLTPQWRIEWGGLLMLHGADGDIERALVPAFNTLSLFAVPKMHSVSEVSASAPRRRVSVTGWLRTRRPAGEED